MFHVYILFFFFVKSLLRWLSEGWVGSSQNYTTFVPSLLSRDQTGVDSGSNIRRYLCEFSPRSAMAKLCNLWVMMYLYAFFPDTPLPNSGAVPLKVKTPARFMSMDLGCAGKLNTPVNRFFVRFLWPCGEGKAKPERCENWLHSILMSTVHSLGMNLKTCFPWNLS